MSVRIAHANLLVALADNMPHEIRGSADSSDIEERREHLDQVFSALAIYVHEVLRETNSDLPVTLTVKSKEFLAGFEDLIGDTVLGPLQHSQEALLEEESEAA